MPGHVRITDLCSGHGSCRPRPNVTSSLDTYVNSLNATRFNDVRVIHCDHIGKNIGVHNVFVNSRMSQTCGDPVD